MWSKRRRKSVVEEDIKAQLEAMADPKADSIVGKHKFESEEETWDEMCTLPLEDRIFFGHLFIAKDGGMDEIGGSPSFALNGARRTATIVLLVFVVYNILAIILADIDLMTSVDPKPPQYLLSASLLSPVLSWYGIDVGHLPKRVAGAVECFFLSMRCLQTYLHYLNIRYNDGYQRYRSVVLVAWELLPDLSIFSSLRLLQYVVPQQATYDATVAFFYDSSPANIAFFVISRPLCLVAGFDFLLIKIRLVRQYIDVVDASIIRVAKAGIFLCQLLGVVQIGKACKIRLYRFIFGGEDGVMQDDEKVRQDVWEAMVVREFMNGYNKWHAFCLILTFNDDDFQLLLLNEGSNEGAGANAEVDTTDDEAEADKGNKIDLDKDLALM